jgi:hypothetical protein
MVIDSIQGNLFQLPLQAWPMAMAPAYGMGGALTPPGLFGNAPGMLAGSASQPLGNLSGVLPWQAAPLTALVYGGSTPVPSMLAPAQATLQAEQQAMDSFLREVAAGPIRKLHDYLEAHSQKYSQLTQCIPFVQQAATAFGAHDYAQALAHIYQVYRYITALRTSVPDLPGL